MASTPVSGSTPSRPGCRCPGRYSYAFVEKVLDLPNNRSNMGRRSWIHGHAEAPDASRVLVAGLARRAPVDGVHQRRVHSNSSIGSSADNNFHISGGVAYSFPRLDVFASYIHYADGTDTHAGRAFSAGVSWPFELR